jgi:membrane-associated protease RseP (regulator of RpoE activity)
MVCREVIACVTAAVWCWTASGVLAQAPPPPVADPQVVPSEPEAIPAPTPSATSPTTPEAAVPAAPHATLGVQLQSVTDLALVPGTYVVREGARITGIVPGSPADRVGLPLGGVIVAIDGQKVSSPADAARIMQSLPPAAKIELKYYDGNRLFRKSVQLIPTAGLSDERTVAVPEGELPPPPRERSLPMDRRRVLDGIGRVLEEFVPSGPVPPGLIPPGMPLGPVVEADRLAELEAEVESLRKQVQELQRRLMELEQRLPAVPPEK